MHIFKYLFILGRPASGKSEFIDFMKKISDGERTRLFHIGGFEEVDDYPWIVAAAEEDDRREKRGERRLNTRRTEEGINLLKPKFRSSQMGKFNDAILKYGEHFFDGGTLLIEFARGKGDGFADSLEKIKSEILREAAILYIDVSFEESFRKNNARYEAALKESILFHKVPDKDMYEYFIENDWADITGGKSHGYLDIRGVKVPFISMNNEPESADPAVLTERYGSHLNRLFELYSKS